MEPNPAAVTLIKGKLKKTVVYIRSRWVSDENSYALDVWSQGVDGTWVERVDGGVLEPFGIDFPDSKTAGLYVEVDLDPTGMEGGEPNILTVDALVNLKIKPDKKNPGGEAFDGETSLMIAADADDSTVESALESLINIGEGNVSVATMVGDDGFLVNFQNDLGGQDVPLLTVESDTTDGTGVMVSVTTEGGPGSKAALKSASFKVDKVVAGMEAIDVGLPGAADNEVYGTPKFSAKRQTEDQLPFEVSKPL